MSVLKKIDESIIALNQQLNWAYYARTFVLEHLSAFDLLPDATLHQTFIDFDNLSHEQVMEVIKAFPGRWKKEPNEGRINYSITLRNSSKTTELYEIVIRCYSGEPPPNCKIVYEEVMMPAHMVRKAKLMCVDTPVVSNGHDPLPIQDAELVITANDDQTV